MALSENTSVTLKIGTIVVLVGMIVTAAIRLYVYDQRLTHAEKSLQATRNWLFVLRYPNETWSKNYADTHTFLED